nr:MAG TPA: hypothetical protein [Caudoviricetes sp.]
MILKLKIARSLRTIYAIHLKQSQILTFLSTGAICMMQ